MSDDAVETTSLRRIAVAIERIGRYTAGLTAEEFQSDTMVQDAVLRNFEVISDQTRGIAPARRAARPGLPWDELEQLAARVFEGTNPREPAAVWGVIQEALPPLVGPLGAVLKEGRIGEDQAPG